MGTMGGSEDIIAGVFETGGLRLDRALADVSGLSRERIKALIEEGRIEVGGRVATQASAKTGAGGAFAIRVPEVVPAEACLLYTSPSPRDGLLSRMPSSA